MSRSDKQRIPLPRFYIAKNRTLLNEAGTDPNGALAILYNVNIKPFTKDLYRLQATVVICEPMGTTHGFDESSMDKSDEYEFCPKAWSKLRVVKVVEGATTVINSDMDRSFFKKVYNMYKLSTKVTGDLKKIGDPDIAKEFVHSILNPVASAEISNVNMSSSSNVNKSTSLKEFTKIPKYNTKDNVPISSSGAVVSDPTPSKAISSPITSKEDIKPAASKAVSIPTTSKAASKPAATKEINDPAPSKVVSNSTATKVNKNPTAIKSSSNNTVSKVINTPTIPQAINNPTTSKAVSNATCSKPTTAPTTSKLTGIPTSIKATKAPKAPTDAISPKYANSAPESSARNMIRITPPALDRTEENAPPPRPVIRLVVKNHDKPTNDTESVSSSESIDSMEIDEGNKQQETRSISPDDKTEAKSTSVTYERYMHDGSTPDPALKHYYMDTSKEIWRKLRDCKFFTFIN